METKKHTLSNGIRVLMAEMPSMESVTVQVFIRAGSRDEKKNTNGLAHFLEHMVFKGAGKYKTAKSISSAIDSVGAEGNANTGKERTAFYIRARDRHIKLAFDILSGFITSPILDQAEINKEKGVILEEIAMYNDLPTYLAPSLFEKLVYNGKPLGWDVLGTKKNIRNITREDFVKYRQTLYSPENIVLSIAGKFQEKEVLDLSKEYFGDMKQGSQVEFISQELKINPDANPQARVLNKKTEQAHIVLGFRSGKLGGPDRYVENVIAGILGGGMSSRLFEEIREKRGLAYYIHAGLEKYVDNGYLGIKSGIRLDNLKEAIKIILGECSQVAGGSVKEKELSCAKEYIKGKLALSLEDTGNVSEFFGEDELLEGRIRTVKDIEKGIDDVSLGDIRRVGKKIFENSRLNFVVVGPYNGSNQFQKLLKV